MPQIVWTATVDGKLDYINGRWQQYTGLTIRESLGAGWTDALHRDDAASIALWENAVATGSDYEAEYRLRRADGLFRWMLSRAVAMRDQKGKIVKWFGTTTDIQSQRRRELTLQCLDEAADVLGQSLDISSVMTGAARFVAQRIADWCAIYVCRPDGSMAAGAIEHCDPAKAALALEFAHEYALQLSGATFDAFIRVGKALLMPAVLLETLREAGLHDPIRFGQLVQQLDICTTICVPLRAADGLWGVLQLVTTPGGRTLNEEDLPLAQLLAKRVETALANAIRFEAKGREARSLIFLAAAGETLSASLDLQATLEVLLSLVVPKMADLAIINLLDDDSGRLLVRAVQAADPAKALLLQGLLGKSYVRQEGIGGSASVLSAGLLQIIPQFSDEILSEIVDEGFHETARRLDMNSAILAPLMSHGRILGSLSLIWSKTKPAHSKSDFALVEELARRASIAIANATEYEHELRVANSFQDASLPTALPAVPGFLFEACYQPGTAQARVGGDWYDAVRIADGRIVISVGDVVGSGLAAAVTMATVRHVIRGVAHVTPDPVTMLNAADKTLRAEYPETFVTALVAILDPVTMILTCASAGHPAPLMLAPDNTVTTVGLPGLPLGLRGRDEPSTHNLHLAPDSLLVFYTDGLIESTHDLFEGERRLRSSLRRDRLPSTGVAKAIFEAVLFDGVRDDVAILTIAIAPIQPGRTRTSIARWSFDVRDADAARNVRLALTDLLVSRRFSEADVYAAQLVFGELIGNVLRHAPGNVEVAVDWSGLAPVLHVLDRGRGFRHISALPADMLSESGRGLFLAATLTAELHISKRPDGGSHARAVLEAGTTHRSPTLPSLDLLLGV
jgi:PAS domain S-box-containing protein